MSHPIHHSVVNHSGSNQAKRTDLIVFTIFILTYIVSILAEDFRLFIGLMCFFVAYEIYTVTTYPSTSILSINMVSMDDLRLSVRYALIGGLVSVAYIIILQVVAFLTSVEIVIHKDLTTVSFTVTTVFVFAVIPSIVEEVVFRHFLQGRVLSSMGKTTRIVLPTTVFVYAHVPAYSYSLSGLLAVTALLPTSFIMAIIYEETDSIFLPVALHFSANTLAVFFFATIGGILI